MVVFANSNEQLQEIVNIYSSTCRRFGLSISRKKTKTMIFNVSEVQMNKKSIINLFVNDSIVALENIREFCYLGFTIANKGAKSEQYLNDRISKAYQKWNELKMVLTDNNIRLKTRIKFLETCVRSRLLYSVQCWNLNLHEIQKLETIWNNFLRRMVRGGYRRGNTREENKLLAKSDQNWKYVINNEKLRKITGTTPLTDYCNVQFLKFTGHLSRCGNDYLPKQLLFAKNGKHRTCVWKRIEKMLRMDQIQIKKAMQNTKGFLRLLDSRYNIKLNCFN